MVDGNGGKTTGTVRISVEGGADLRPCQLLNIETMNLNQLKQTNLN